MDAHFEDEFMKDADDALIDRLYGTYLDELLTSKDTKESMLQTRSFEDKRSTILEHKRKKRVVGMRKMKLKVSAVKAEGLHDTRNLVQIMSGDGQDPLLIFSIDSKSQATKRCNFFFE